MLRTRIRRIVAAFVVAVLAMVGLVLASARLRSQRPVISGTVRLGSATGPTAAPGEVIVKYTYTNEEHFESVV